MKIIYGHTNTKIDYGGIQAQYTLFKYRTRKYRFRKNNLGATFPGSTINVYEWIE